MNTSKSLLTEEKHCGVKVQGVSHLSRAFRFSISSEELRGDFRNRGFVVTVRGGGGGGSGRRGRLGRTASGQLGRGHVIIELGILIVHLLFQLALDWTGVQHLWVLGLDRASMQAERRGEEDKVEG